MFNGEFKGARTAYSSSSVFIAILANPQDKYDAEAIGEQIFPDGFGAVNPPGPSFGFGSIALTEKEDSGRVMIKDLADRKDDDGNDVSEEQITQSLEEYMDAFFRVDIAAKKIIQITFDEFGKSVRAAKDFKLIHFCEFEPDE